MKWIGCLVVGAMVLASGGNRVFAAVADELELYPGGEIVQAADMDAESMAVVKCPDASIGDVYAYYKSLAERQGWTVAFEETHQAYGLFMAEKDGKRLMVDVGAHDGVTTASLNIVEKQ